MVMAHTQNFICLKEGYFLLSVLCFPGVPPDSITSSNNSKKSSKKGHQSLLAVFAIIESRGQNMFVAMYGSIVNFLYLQHVLMPLAETVSASHPQKGSNGWTDVYGWRLRCLQACFSNELHSYGDVFSLRILHNSYLFAQGQSDVCFSAWTIFSFQNILHFREVFEPLCREEITQSAGVQTRRRGCVQAPLAAPGCCIHAGNCPVFFFSYVCKEIHDLSCRGWMRLIEMGGCILQCTVTVHGAQRGPAQCCCTGGLGAILIKEVFPSHTPERNVSKWTPGKPGELPPFLLLSPRELQPPVGNLH